MERIKSGVNFIFSSYKTTAAMLFVMAILLTIPVTISTLSQQQDVRQRASETCESGVLSPRDQRIYEDRCQNSNSITPECQRIREELARSCPPPTSTPTPLPTVTPSPTSRPTTTPTRSATRTPTPSRSVTATPITTLTTTPSLTITNSPTPPGNLTIAQTNLRISLQITGVGSDSARGLNRQPVRPQRNIKLDIYNAQNVRVAQTSGIANFDATSGLYRSQISAQLATGPYTFKVKFDNTLFKLIPGVQSITAGTQYTAPVTTLVSGDVNGDNTIDLIDYNLMMACIARSGICIN